MKELKEKLSKLSVLVFGNVYLDKDYIGNYSGYSREKESLSILRTFLEKYNPGGAGNLAVGFSALGVKTTVISLWGNDLNRELLANELAKKKVETSYMVESGNTQVFGKFYLQSGTHVFRYDVISDGMSNEVEERLIENVNAVLPSVNFIACADYNEASVRDICSENTLKAIAKSELPKFATGRKSVDKFQGFDYFFLNDAEVLVQSEKKGAEYLIDKLGLKQLIATSADGATVFDKESTSCFSKAVKLEGEIDTCGCGDTFYATYASCKVAGYNTKDSLKIANCAAGIVAKKMFGADQATVDEILEKL